MKKILLCVAISLAANSSAAFSLDLGKGLTNLKENFDREATRLKENFDREATTAQENINREATQLRINIETEFNQLGGQLCGQSSEQLAIQRKYDQGKINREEYESQMANTKKGRSGSCGGGGSFNSNGDVVATDGQGTPSEKPAEKNEDIVIIPAPESIPENVEDIFPYGQFVVVEEHAESDIHKPPFTATPLGQALSANTPVSNNAEATPTTNSPNGGYGGMTRSQNTKYHGGFDDPSTSPMNDEVAKYYGPTEGTVKRSGPAYTNNGVYLGERVTIQFVDESGVWESTTMHHKEVLVIEGAKVQPGQPIAVGSGAGDQFNSPQAGEAHVHWRLKLNGKDMDVLDGIPLERLDT